MRHLARATGATPSPSILMSTPQTRLVTTQPHGKQLCLLLMHSNPLLSFTGLLFCTHSTPPLPIPKTRFEYVFNLMYTVYSLPNIILPFFGGYFVDRLGARSMIVLFALLCLAGQFLVAIGASAGSTFVILVGRVIFGLGGESLCVGLSTLLAEWFMGKEMAFAMGLNLSVARVGSFVNDMASPAIAHHTGSVTNALWFSVLVCVMSLASALGLFALDRWAEKRTLGHSEKETSGDPVRLTDVKHFPLPFWLLATSCVVTYGCVLPFNNIASAFIIEKYICVGGPCCPGNQTQCPQHVTAEATAGFMMG